MEHIQVISPVCMRWFPAVVGLVVLSGPEGCAPIPGKFVKQAEPGVTFAMLGSHPENYRGKVVILGGTVVTQKEESGHVWLLVENRPLDADHVPHLPPSPDNAEAGKYWIRVAPEGLPKTFRNWSRLTVVGLVSGEPPLQHERGTGKEPVLAALYLHGWGSRMGGYGLIEDTWEAKQPANPILSTPMKVKPAGY